MTFKNTYLEICITLKRTFERSKKKKEKLSTDLFVIELKKKKKKVYK